VRFQNVNTGGCLVEIPGRGPGVTGRDVITTGEQWWAATQTTGVYSGWFQSLVTYGCLDDSTSYSLRVAPCAQDPSVNANQVFYLE
jgi:hypothetical protein